LELSNIESFIKEAKEADAVRVYGTFLRSTAGNSFDFQSRDERRLYLAVVEKNSRFFIFGAFLRGGEIEWNKRSRSS
jgi:hypothetical protein